ncbi:MAG: DUF4832 domain-containing protein [Chitinophagales bacterium]
MNLPKYLLTFLLLSPFILLFPQNQTVTYNESFDDILNPDRGFYHPIDCHTSNFQPLLLSDLQSKRTTAFTPWQGNYSIRISVILRHYILDSFVNTDNLSTTFLNHLQSDFDIARQAGVRLVLRFSYTITPSQSCGDTACPPYGDAPKARVLAHISQLAPYLQANEDVILVVQNGFIGIWGEQYYTDYFGDASGQGAGKLTNQNWQDRIEVLSALLDAVPESRMVQVRYPQMKQKYVYGGAASVTSAAMTSEQAHNASDIARIGFHNDCFLASSDDYGTYWDYGSDTTFPSNQTAILKPYAADDSQFVCVGGETCDDAFSPQNNCSGQAVSDMAALHYTFLNSDYNNEVNNDWQTDNCMDEIKRRLGYRLVMKSGTYPLTASAGETFSFTLGVENVGFAAPVNERFLQIVLRNTADDSEYKALISGTNTDTRFWLPATTTTLNGTVTLPANMPVGNYALFLQVFDTSNDNEIATRPEYSLQFANTNTWESLTGYNDLKHILSVNAAVRFQAKVWLQGAYQTNSNNMSNSLQNNNLLSSISPYNAAPWNEVNGNILTSFPANAVDWMMVELLDSDYNSVEKQMAFVDTNGNLMDVSGSEGVPFFNVNGSTSYFVVLRHRNHLDIMSATILNLNAANPHNFTSPSMAMGGSNQLADLGNGEYGMSAGDVDGNGVITVADYNLYVSQISFINQYLQGDLNLDGSVTVMDFNLLKDNVSKIGVLWVRY